MTDYHSQKNRYVCSVLEEMRTVLELAECTERESRLLSSLIEEAQVYVNRMEAAIYDYQDVLAKYKTLNKIKSAIRREKSRLGTLEHKKK